MVLHHLLLDGVLQILHTSFHLLQVDVAETTVEQDLARVELEDQPELPIVDQRVAAEVKKCVVEVRQGLLEITQQKVGNTLLKVSDGEVPVEFDSALVAFDLWCFVLASIVFDGGFPLNQREQRKGCWGGGGPTYSLLVLAECRIDHAHVEQNLGGIRDPLKGLEGFVELIVVVVLEGLDPSFYFL